jgi:hypothetical protein
MPLYATKAADAYDNVFIKTLFDYKKKRAQIVQMQTRVTEDEDKVKIADLCVSAAMDYQRAVLFAYHEACTTKDTNDQKNFKDWLTCNKAIIIGVFLDLSDACGNQLQRINTINKQLEGCIEALTAFSELETKKPSRNFEIKCNELKHVKNILAKRPGKTILISNFAHRFYDVLNTLISEELFDWYKEEANQLWISSHYELLKNTFQANPDTDESREFNQEWELFEKNISLNANEDSRKLFLNQQVEHSIALCHAYEKMSALQKASERLKMILDQASKRLKLMINQVKKPGVYNKVVEFLETIAGTLLYPVVATGLLISDAITGKNRLTSYHQFLKKNWVSAYEVVKENPWTSLLVGLSMVGGIALTIATGGAAFAGLGVFAHGLSVSTVTVSLLGGVGGIVLAKAEHAREIAAINQKHADEIRAITIQHGVAVEGTHQNYAKALRKSENIANDEKNQENSEDVKEWIILLRQQQTKKQLRKQQTPATEVQMAANRQHQENKALAKGQQLWDQANPEDLQEASKEISQNITNITQALIDNKKNQNELENVLQGGETELNNFDANQNKLREEISSSAKKLAEFGFFNSNSIQTNPKNYQQSEIDELVKEAKNLIRVYTEDDRFDEVGELTLAIKQKNYDRLFNLVYIEEALTPTK